MTVTQTWHRNPADTLTGESITVKITYSSFDANEIDELEKKMPTGMLYYTDDPKKYDLYNTFLRK